jgi:hypothetical protein
MVLSIIFRVLRNFVAQTYTKSHLLRIRKLKNEKASKYLTPSLSRRTPTEKSA